MSRLNTTAGDSRGHNYDVNQSMSRRSQKGIPCSEHVKEPKTIENAFELRERTLMPRREAQKRLADNQRSILRDLYHVMQTKTTMTLPPSAIARAGEDPPELQSFLDKYSLANTHASIRDVLLPDALVDEDEEMQYLEPYRQLIQQASSTIHSPVTPPISPIYQLHPSPRQSIEPSSSEGDILLQPSPPRLPPGNLHAFEAVSRVEPVVMKEESPPPPQLVVPPIPTISLPPSYVPIQPTLKMEQDMHEYPLPDSELVIDERLSPLVTDYAASLYPLPPPEVHKKKRKEKKESKRWTLNGTAAVDLNKWEAIMIVNPTVRLVKKATKCLMTSEWQVMFNELRYTKTMARINELKAAGLWSFRQPKKQKGPTLHKTHHDYLLDEMKWMQVDFKEERKWKTAVALRLAHSALDWFHASPQRRKELSVKWQIPRTDDELDADRVKAEIMDIDMADSEREAEPCASRKESDVENISYQRTRTTITVQPRSRVVDDDEDGDDDEDDDGEDDETAAKAVQAQAALDAGTAVKEAAEDLEARIKEKEGEQDEALQIMDVVKTAVPEGKVDEDAEGEADADAEMDAEGEVEAEGDPDVGVQDINDVVEPLGIPDVVEAPAAAPPDATGSTLAEPSEPPSRGRSALRPGAENVPLSSTALSILDTKTLRTPLLNLDLEETIVDLSEMIEESLSIDERGSLTPERDSISLPNLFPELDLYSFAEPPISGGNDKKSRRVDESGMSVGRLTLATRIMDSKNVLVSSLQPGKQYRQGVWDILGEIPVPEEPRDGQDNKSDATPPAAPMFYGSKSRDHVHPNAFTVPSEPADKETRLQMFTWVPEDDTLLKSLVNQLGFNWHIIADVFNSSRLTIDTDQRLPWDVWQRWMQVNDEDSTRQGTPSEASVLPGARTTVSKVNRKPIVLQTKNGGLGKRTIRHALLHEVMKRDIKKRGENKSQSVKPRAPQALHETHQAVSQQKVLTPAELTRIKFERDNQLLQQQIALERRRQQDLVRQQAARNGQPMQSVPNIAQTPRLQGSSLTGGAGQPLLRSGLASAQQAIMHAQAQVRAGLLGPQQQQQLAQAQQQLAQQQQQQQQQQGQGQQPPQLSQQPGTNSQSMHIPGSTGHPSASIPQPSTSSSPAPSQASPAQRPPSTVPPVPIPGGLTPAQAQTAAISFGGRPQITPEQYRSFQLHGQMTPETVKNAVTLQQAIWAQRLNQQSLAQQQQHQQSQPSVSAQGHVTNPPGAPGTSASPHPSS